MTGKSKIVQAPSLVGTLLNMKQQFKIDVNVTCISLAKMPGSLFFSFLKKCSFLNTTFETVKNIW